MSKRRTRKEKETAHHSFTVSWKPSPEASSVKSQNKKIKSNTESQSQVQKNTINMALSLDLASIRTDLLKSISIASFIILFELVIYFFEK